MPKKAYNFYTYYINILQFNNYKTVILGIILFTLLYYR